MKTLIALSVLAALGLACRKPPQVESKDQSQAVPAGAPAPAAPAPVSQGRIDASPLNGAALIQKAQGAAASANGAVQQEQKQDVPQQ